MTNRLNLAEISRFLLSKKFILTLFTVLFMILTIKMCVSMINRFPSSYVWGELLINYEGGFLRRGLLGELFYLVDPLIPTKYFAPFFMMSLYVLFAVLFIRLLIKTQIEPAWYFILLSPLLLLFPFVHIENFCRKDIVIQLAFLLMMMLCWRRLKGYASSLLILSLAFAVLHIIATLTHEMAIFYLPLPALMLGAVFHREGKILLWFVFVSILGLSCLLLSLKFSGTIEMQQAIRESWSERYPGAELGGGLRYIGIGMSDVFNRTLQYLQHPISIFSITGGFLLALFPVWLLSIAMRPTFAARQVLNTPPLQILYYPALLTPFILFVLVYDYGRFISVTFIEFIIFFCFICDLCPQNSKPIWNAVRKKIALNTVWRLAMFCALMWYAFGWRMSHWQPIGESFLRFGLF
ncbi:MAG: hypothetical protein LBV80_03420 [Deltaproteobacteria bacterium]|jgi:hypothetical protein|nr:hypothetical protein [Deltaproteobacteria bacterium]